jgi:hypothetical protein
MNEKMKSIVVNRQLLEKFMLAWYVSIPSDNPVTPKKIFIRKINGDDIYYSKINTKDIMYGIGRTTINELNTYFEQIKSASEFEKKLFEEDC